MRKLRVVFGVIALAGVAVVGLHIGIGAGGQVYLSSQVMTATQLDEVGLPLQAVPAGAASARVSGAEAALIAGELRGRADQPAEVIRIMVRQFEGSTPRSAYLVVYRGGPDLPGGPSGEVHRTALSGVVIDDQTGEYLRGFYYGVPNP